MALPGCQTPRLSHVPEGDTARGDEAVEFARFCGLTLYPWQEGSSAGTRAACAGGLVVGA